MTTTLTIKTTNTNTHKTSNAARRLASRFHCCTSDEMRTFFVSIPQLLLPQCVLEPLIFFDCLLCSCQIRCWFPSAVTLREPFPPHQIFCAVFTLNNTSLAT